MPDMLAIVPGVKTDVRNEIRVTPRVRFNLYVLHATRAEVITLVADAVEENPYVEQLPRGTTAMLGAPPSAATSTSTLFPPRHRRSRTICARS